MATGRKIVTIIVIILLLAILIAGATIALSRSRLSHSSFEEELFENPTKLALCFDLRNEDRILAGLVINTKSDTTKGQHIVLVPFRSIEAQPNTRLVTTWGSHGAFTILTYIASDRMGSPNGIGVVPRVPSYTLEEINVGAGSRDSVYLVRAGLERRFIYRYATADQLPGSLPIEAQSLVDPLDSIGVAIPENAEFREVRPGFSEIPTNEYSNGRARFYPASAAKAGTDHIELRYAFKATDKQTLFVELAIQLFVAIGVAIVLLKGLRPEDVREPKKRRRWLWGGIILQVVFIAGLVTYFIFTHEPGESEWRAIGTGSIVIVGEVLGVVVMGLKKKSD